MSMYDPSLQWAVLALLEKYDRLPLSDLVNMLAPFQRPRFRPDLVKDMEWEGLITVQTLGDDDVLTVTPRGLASLAGRRPVGGSDAS